MPSDFRSDDMLPVLPPEFVNAPRPQLSFDALLPKPKNLQLTSDQVTELAAFEAAFIILGPAGGAVLQCPGNQENLLPEQKCPYWAIELWSRIGAWWEVIERQSCSSRLGCHASAGRYTRRAADPPLLADVRFRPSSVERKNAYIKCHYLTQNKSRSQAALEARQPWN